MNRRFPRMVFAATFLLSAIGTNAPSSTAATEGLDVALGDSVAAGIGSSLPRTRGYPALVYG
ncbi:MAG: hypothetical protein ACRD1H_15330 [Vicinamibacterales bacterium]